jgi:nitrogen fixation protein FixH
MSTQLARISQRQVTGRWMDRAFLGLLAVIVTLSVTSVSMAVNAAAAPVAPISTK